MKSRRARQSLAVIALLGTQLCGSITAFAQQGVASATLSGRIEDSSGAAVTGATIAITNIDRNQPGRTSSDDHGRYSFLYLPVGSYQLKAEHPGFTSLSSHLTLSVGQALDLPLRMSVAGVTENINVMAGVPVIETVRSQVGETIVPKAIDTLPLNGRNYLDLALLVPAVSRTNVGSNQRFAETSAVPGTGISIAGQRNLNNGFILDGLSANDDAADLAGTFFSQEVIREFQVVTSGGIAEFGRASGGFVNMISQSGTRDWRGRLYGFLRNQRFDARNPLAPTKDNLTQTQYGGTVGGPIVRERTFLFSNFEQTRRNDSLVITISPANVAAINDELDSINLGGPRIETGNVPAGFDSTNLF
ncbi:MAG TPA: carboxypeptidase-like regulatory domain-containing protein, partial [Blastocatellia bacterium]|nr:carboxypeptidase-like regulatory domain-containing protein [Blastocatellia bacterium]